MAQAHDPGGKFTIFSVLTLAGAIAGLVIGIKIGRCVGANYGLAAGWVAGIVLSILGCYLGALPGHYLGERGVLSLLRELNGMETAQLYRELESKEYLTWAATFVLKQRGEPPGRLIDHSLAMLLDKSSGIRWAGWRSLNLNFPEIATELEGIEPLKAPDAFRERVEELRAQVADGTLVVNAGET